MACNPFGGDSQEETRQQLVEMVRGDLIVSVSGSGSIEVSNEARVVFGTGGMIDKIFVDEGDEVAEGEVLAKLDTAPLELALIQAQTALAQAQAALAQAEVARIQAQIAQAPAQAALAQAQATLTQAQAVRIQAQLELNIAEDNLEDAEDLYRRLKRFLDRNDSKLEAAEVLFETAELEFEVAETQFAAAELQFEAAGLQLEIAESQLEVVEPQLEAADLQVEMAEQALEEAQKQLDRVTITAPFDGVVVSVDVDEGDTVSTATPIVHLIDLTSIELEVEVDEIDIAEVKLGQRAIIEVDALPALQLEGKVTSIPLLSKETGGLVIYEVTIGFDVPQGYNLKIGMSAIADIILEERSNVLLVPNRAITQDVVKVMVDEEIEERLVVRGISDGFDTEIVDGLNEGDVVVIETKVKPSAPGLF